MFTLKCDLERGLQDHAPALRDALRGRGLLLAVTDEELTQLLSSVLLGKARNAECGTRPYPGPKGGRLPQGEEGDHICTATRRYEFRRGAWVDVLCGDPGRKPRYNPGQHLPGDRCCWWRWTRRNGTRSDEREADRLFAAWREAGCPRGWEPTC